MRKLLTLLALTFMAITANAQVYCYDTNGDGEINITDVICLVNRILGIPNPGEEPQVLLSCPDNNHPHAIDLSLPSGTKWACCNVGASSPEEKGNTYQWGSTEKEQDTPFWAKKVSVVSGTQYDVAHVKWGDSWQMPNNYSELSSNCDHEKVTYKGTIGMIFISKLNGNSIFFPFKSDTYGGYWTGSPHGNTYDAYGLWMNNNELEGGGNSRFVPSYVRPVWVP